MILRDYQEYAISLVRNKFATGHKRVLLVLPTGSGKSIILGHMARRCLDRGNKLLALMHRRQLVEQLSGRFQDCGVNSSQIMAGISANLDSYCQIATVQTYSRRIKLPSIWSDKSDWHINADVLFIDEAHHILSKTYQNVLNEYHGKYVVGVTATPILASGVGLGNYFDTLVQPITIKRLIENNYLVPAVYYGLDFPDLSDLKIVAGDYERVGLDKKMNNLKIIGDVFENWIRICGDKKTMIFAVNVKHSKALAIEFNKRGISAEHLDAHNNDDDRSETIDRFRNGKIQVICNVGLYTEGTDIPEIEAIVLARPTRSLGLHLQMLGRGARPYPGKENFLVLDHGGNINRLGMYEEDIEWDLNGKKIKFEDVQRRVKEKKYMTCEKCGTIFSGQSYCPRCYTDIPDYGRKIASIDAELKELTKTKEKYTMEDKQSFYGMLEYCRKQKGYKPGWTYYKFKERFGIYPSGKLKKIAIEPDEKFLRYLKYMQIRAAKSRSKSMSLA